MMGSYIDTNSRDAHKSNNSYQLGDDLRRIRSLWSTGSVAWADLGSEERAAVPRIFNYLATLGEQLTEMLGPPGAFIHQTNLKALRLDTARARIPVRFWLRVAAAPNDGVNHLAIPSIYLTLSADVCELGLSVAAAGDDTDATELQRWIKRTAPDAFNILRQQRIDQNNAIGHQGGADWIFKRNENPVLEPVEIAGVNEWLGFRKVLKEDQSLYFSISKTLPLEVMDGQRLDEEMAAAAGIFDSLLAVDIAEPGFERANSRPAAAQIAPTVVERKRPTSIHGAFADLLNELSEGRPEAVTTDGALAASIANLAGRISDVMGSAAENTVKVSIEAGYGAWVQRPWIGMQDSRMKESDDQANYAGLLLSEDFSTLSFLLYHGTRYSVPRFGGRAVVAEMQRSFRRLSDDLEPMRSNGFETDRNRYLLSETEFELKYEDATIVKHSIAFEALRSDDCWRNPLLTLLNGYLRLVESTMKKG